MDDKPDFKDVGRDPDPVGNIQTRRLQEQGRVDIPEHFYEHLGIDVGDNIMIVCEEDGVKIVEATVDKLSLSQNG